MRKNILFLLLLPLLSASCFAGVGTKDTRQYVTDEMWAQEPYNRFVFLKIYIGDSSYYYFCSGQYIAHDLILSAGHCVEPNATRYTATNYKNEQFNIDLLEYATRQSKESTGDWAIFRVKDEEYYNDSYFQLTRLTQPQNKPIQVLNAGWGWVRILSDEEITNIRNFLVSGDGNTVQNKRLDDVYNDLSKTLNIQSLRDNPNKLKYSTCTISDSYSTTLKNFFYTTCDGWQGNSGSGYIDLSDKNSLYGVCSFGEVENQKSFTNEGSFDVMSSASTFYNKIQKFITSDTPSTNSTTDTPAQSDPGSVTSDVPSTDAPAQQASVDVLEAEIYNLTAEVDAIANTPVNINNNITDNGVLNIINSVVEYDVKKEQLAELQQAYEEAKEREQSLANRMLGGVTMALTGIGGMELAQGLAEQRADKDAEMDMTAYMETFRCEYGNGKNVKGGTSGIQLPSDNLFNLYQEYITLAADLKERKEALGLKPGNESEVILDKANTGLYDDTSTGITNGTFASLYRAKMGNETDKAKLQEMADTSKKRVVGGAIAAGAGVVIGTVGNMLINGKKDTENLRQETENITKLSISSNKLLKANKTNTTLSTSDTSELLRAIQDKFK